MLPERRFKKAFATVTLGMLDGRAKGGRLTAFSPSSTEQRLELVGGRGGNVTVLVPTEQIAYVAFQREPGERITRVKGRRPVRIYTSGSVPLVLEVDPKALTSTIGFYGTPVADDSPDAEVFVYAHGVHATESVEPIGEMLLRRGALTEEALSKGLEAHVAQRTVPLGQILVDQEKVTVDAVEEAARLQHRKRMRIGEVLVEAGLVTAEDVERALVEQKKRNRKKLGDVLVELGLVTEVELALTLSEKFGIPFVNLDDFPIDAGAARRVPREIIEKFEVLPLRGDARSLTIAISDPLATDALDVLRVHLKGRVQEVLATTTQLRQFVRTHLEQGERPAEDLQSIMEQLAVDAQTADLAASLVEPPADVSDNAVIKLVNQIVADAYKRGASDIHIEPNGDEAPTLVRLRIDGDCVLYQELPPSVRASIVARVKIMANLDISERRKPQDGKIRFRFHDRVIELRVATIPTVNGNEDVVLRVLAGSKPLPIERLALGERNLAELRRLASRPYGLILCVGPTGSGKTTTLHSVLGSINQPDMKIWTAEDPVEITQPGLRQVQVQPRIGFTFAAAMRAFLRADPDVIMVGEMRDPETASTAVEASLTGHLVFSTLHTNSAPETVTRLIDMGVDPFTFADALLGVLAQRLARALCTACARPYAPSATERNEVTELYGPAAFATRSLPADFSLWRGEGCERCGGTGYHGRVGLHELLVVTDAMRHAIQHKAPGSEIRRLAIEGGMTTLVQDGLEKAFRGTIDLLQVAAVSSR